MRTPLLALLLAACPARPPSPAPPAVADNPAAVLEVSAPPVVEAQCRGVWFGKPPMKTHSLDVTLRNPASEPRWLVLPSTFPYAGRSDPAPGGNEVELQPFRVGAGQGLVVLGVGGNFWAVRLPPEGTMTLRRLRIDSWWETIPPTVDLVVLVARELAIDGVPLATILGADPTSASGLDDAAPGDAADARLEEMWHPAKGAPAAIAIDVDSRSTIRVPLEPCE